MKTMRPRRGRRRLFNMQIWILWQKIKCKLHIYLAFNQKQIFQQINPPKTKPNPEKGIKTDLMEIKKHFSKVINGTGWIRKLFLEPVAY